MVSSFTGKEKVNPIRNADSISNQQLYRQIGFIEEIQRIYNKQKGTGDYAKDNVKTIVFGYGKTGI